MIQWYALLWKGQNICVTVGINSLPCLRYFKQSPRMKAKVFALNSYNFHPHMFLVWHKTVMLRINPSELGGKNERSGRWY